MKLTVGTFNLWRSGEPWRYTQQRQVVRGAVPGSTATTLRPAEGAWARRAPLLASALRDAEVDVVGVQEAGDETSDGANAVAELAERLSFHWVNGPNTGLGVLSKHPVARWSLASLDAPAVRAETEQGYGSGQFLHAVIDCAGTELDFVVAHFSPRSSTARMGAADGIAHYAGQLPDRPVVVVGDFNTPAADAPELSRLLQRPRRLVDAWQSLRPDQPGYTMPSHAPAVRLDYVLLGESVTPIRADLIGDKPDLDGFYASDHLGLVTRLRM